MLLSKKSDVYLSVCMLGQHRKTLRVPPVFPLLFDHRMAFAKVSCSLVVTHIQLPPLFAPVDEAV